MASASVSVKAEGVALWLPGNKTWKEYGISLAATILVWYARTDSQGRPSYFARIQTSLSCNTSLDLCGGVLRKPP
jgi:hypothetical protein